MPRDDAASLRLRLFSLKERGRLGALLAYRNLIDSLTYGLPELQTFGDPEPGRVEGFDSSDPIAEVLLTHWIRAHQLLLQAEATANTGSSVQLLAQAAASVRAIESVMEAALRELREQDRETKLARAQVAAVAAKARHEPWDKLKAFAERVFWDYAKRNFKPGFKGSVSAAAAYVFSRPEVKRLTPPGAKNAHATIYDHLLVVRKRWQREYLESAAFATEK